jgi:lauroyl/myristoyl acyltransferase
LLAERAFAACAKRAYTEAMRTAWRKIRYRLEWVGLKSATKFLPLLSRKACYRLALLLGSLGAMLDRRGRRVALSNLRVAFGDEISAEGRAQIVRESYQHFARTMLDFFWSPRLTSQNFSRYVEFENRERWDEEDRLTIPKWTVTRHRTPFPMPWGSGCSSAPGH